MIIHELLLDMTPIPGEKPQEINLNQEDGDFQLKATLYSDLGEFIIESGTTASIRGRKPDGTAYTKAATLNGHVVTVNGDSNMTAAAGIGVFEFCLTHNGKELYSPNIHACIEPKTA